LTHVFAHPSCLYLGVTFVAEGSSLVLDEPQICQLLVTHLTAKTLRVPSGLHGLKREIRFRLGKWVLEGFAKCSNIYSV